MNSKQAKTLKSIFTDPIPEPHPERVTDKGAVKSVREFLVNAGITLG